MSRTSKEINQELEKLSAIARGRLLQSSSCTLGATGMAEICFMTKEELEQRHLLIQELMQIDKSSLAKERIFERLKQKRGKP